MFRLSFYAIALLTLLSTFSKVAWAFDYDTTLTSAVRDRTDPKKVVLTLSLKGVNPTDRQNFGIMQDEAQVVQQAIVNTLDICLSQDSASCGETDVHVRWAIPRQPYPQVENAYLSTTQLANFDANGTILTQDTTDLNLWQYTLRIIITDTSDIPVGTKVLLRLFPDKVSSNGNKDKTDLVAKLGSGVQDVVEVLQVLGTPKSLILQFQAKSQVNFMDSSVGAPTGVVGLLFPQPDNTTTVPTLVYEATPSATPTRESCTLNVAADNESCTLSCGNTNPQTIDLATASSAGIASSTADASSGTLGFTNVSIANGPYAIVVQYLPEGTGLGCFMGTPTDAGTLIQIGSGKDPQTGDPNCFIATAAYGSALDPHIDALRWFRDAYLLKTSWGRAFVRAYYENSPPVAAWIAEHKTARLVTRGVLWAPVLFIEALRDHRVATLSVLLGLSLLFLVLKRRSSSHSF